MWSYKRRWKKDSKLSTRCELANSTTERWPRPLLLVSFIQMLRCLSCFLSPPFPFSLAPSLILFFQGRAFYINDRWSEISGHDKNEGMGHGWLDLAHHEDLESVAQALRDAISGNPLKLEFRYENKMTDPPSIRWVLGQDLPDILMLIWLI